MSYDVDFIGLVCFVEEPWGRHALFPDGRAIVGVPAHIASIAIAEAAIEGGIEEIGWPADKMLRANVVVFDSSTAFHREALVQFVLSECSLELTGVGPSEMADSFSSEAVGVNDTELVRFLPRLPSQRGFQIRSGESRTITELRIGAGTMAAFRFPGSVDDGSGAIVSRLRVKHDGPITITVTPRGANDDPNVRTIRLQPRTEIAIVNASRPSPQNDDIVEDEAAEDRDHFEIYEQLAPGRITLGAAPDTPIGTPALETRHLLFGGGLIGTSVKCSNTGCC